jgi:Fe-S cluster assembly protein SufD
MLAKLDIFDPSSYPTRRQEDWKYSDLSRVLREAPIKGVKFNEAYYVAVKDGKTPVYPVFDGNYGDGLQRAADRSSGKLRIMHECVGGPDVFGFQGGSQLVLAPNETLVIWESYSGFGGEEGANYAANTALHFKLGEGARLTRVVILDEPEDAISIRRSTVETAPGSVFKQYVFSTGAKFQRFETHVTHAGHGAEVEMHGAYLLKDRRHFDLTTRVNHAQVDGVTAQLIKGLVKDQATAVFQGRILVERGADGTDARMRHQSLILNDGAHVRAKPELEIYADDVQCAHGNTIGALDEEALFFCQSRGMDEATARALLTHAFVMPVAEMIEDEQLRATVLEFLEREAEAFHAL